MGKRVAKNLLLTLTSVILTVGIIEAGFAVFYPQKQINIIAENVFFVEHDLDLGWANKKGAKGMHRASTDEAEVLIRINRQGLRGEDVSAVKQSSRVAALGDSVTFGYGVEEDAAYPSVLARMLSNRYEVLNLGVISYGTDQEYLFLKRDGLSYSPDIVVVGFTPGDVLDNASSIMQNYKKPYFKLIGGDLVLRGTPVPRELLLGEVIAGYNRFKEFLYDNSHLYRFFFNRASKGGIDTGAVIETQREQALELTAALLGAIRDLCGQNGARMLVLLLPNGRWLEDEMAEGRRAGFYTQFMGMLREKGIPYVDPHSALLEGMRRGEELFLTRDPVHLTPAGYEIVAQELYKAINADTAHFK